jgi:hypothetical protein
MKIDSYAFGRIAVNGKTYTADLIIYPDRIDAAWWRKEGHLLRFEDVAQVLKAKPSLLIIGTGYAGMMSVPRETIDRITDQGITVRVEQTSKAVATYNDLQGAATVIAALHITC